MKSISADFFEPYQSGKKLAILVGSIIICLMMACIGFGFAFLGSRLIPGWNGAYLVGIALVLSIESIYSRKRIAGFDQREKMIFRASEWIAFAVLIKILLYLVNDPGQLLKDIPRWQEDFLVSFFTGEYVLALFTALITWWSSAAYSTEIEELYEREADAEWDDLGKLQNALRDIRNRISSRTFLNGTLLVALAVFSRLDISIAQLSPGTPVKSIFPVIIVLVYFLLSLILLTQTQFALLRTRWITQRMPVSPNLARNWIKYGIIFFLFLAVIVFFLPTNYSIGLLDTLKYALGYLVQAAGFLLLIITLPITFCLSLFSFTNSVAEPAPAGGLGALPITPPAVSPGWWDFLRSLAFWIFFLGIIIFALRYYLMQNTALWNALKKFRIFQWISGVVSSLLSWLRGANRQLNNLVVEGWKRLRAQRAGLPIASVRRFLNPARMNAREKIVFYYLSLIRLANERGLERIPSQTPSNYQKVLRQALPDVDHELDGLTGSFLEARYSQHPMDNPNAAQAETFWDRIKAVLRSWQK